LGDLTDNFSRWEFSCRCSCGKDDINMKHVNKLQLARDDAGIGLKINSGCRCEKHNKAEGGKDTSSHLISKATDIQCKTSIARAEILPALMKHFRRIGIGKTFIHVDSDMSKTQDVIWVY
tara:strand:- start:616 stop:975 length:360 start_codon:yes stop_codon:yes gene_type:complete